MRRTLFIALGLGILVAFGSTAPRASSHREAPLISQDPLADNTDVVRVRQSGTARTESRSSRTSSRCEAPYGGPNFYKFDDNVLYEIMVDNNGDAVEDVTYPVQVPDRDVEPEHVPLQHGSHHVARRSRLQRAAVLLGRPRCDGPRRTGAVTRAGREPANAAGERRHAVDAATTTTLAVVHPIAGGWDTRVCRPARRSVLRRSQRVRPARPRAARRRRRRPRLAAGLQRAHASRSKCRLRGSRGRRSRPTSTTDPTAVIGVWSTASRPSMTTRSAGSETSSGHWVQVSRLGQPLVNEVVIPRGAEGRLQWPRADGRRRGAAGSCSIRRCRSCSTRCSASQSPPRRATTWSRSFSPASPD